MIPAWPALSCLMLAVSWYSAKVISEPDKSMRWKLVVLERARNFPGYLSLAVSGETGRAHLGLMVRLRNLSCFIVSADVWHTILHLFVMQSACMLAHIILSASLLLPPPPTPIGLFKLKITSRFMTMKGMGARERKTCWLKDSWPYLPPSTASLDHLYLLNFISDCGNWGTKSQTWGDSPLSILKSFQQCRSRDRLTLSGIPGSYLLCGMIKGCWEGLMCGLFGKGHQSPKKGSAP